MLTSERIPGEITESLLALNLFVASGLSQMSVLRVAKAALPSAAVLLVVLLIVTYVPWLSLVLVD